MKRKYILLTFSFLLMTQCLIFGAAGSRMAYVFGGLKSAFVENVIVSRPIMATTGGVCGTYIALKYGIDPLAACTLKGAFPGVISGVLLAEGALMRRTLSQVNEDHQRFGLKVGTIVVQMRQLLCEVGLLKEQTVQIKKSIDTLSMAVNTMAEKITVIQGDTHEIKNIVIQNNAHVCLDAISKEVADMHNLLKCIDQKLKNKA